MADPIEKIFKIDNPEPQVFSTGSKIPVDDFPVVKSIATREGTIGRIMTPAAGTVPLTVQGAAAQTANLQVWQDSTPTVVAYVHPDGDAHFVHLSLGGTTAPTASTVLNIVETTTGSPFGISATIWSNTTTWGIPVGIYGSAVYTNTTLDQPTLGAVTGCQFLANNTANTKNMNRIHGQTIQALQQSTACTVGDLTGLKIIVQQSVAGTATSKYGINIGGRQNKGTSTNDYGIYVCDIDGPVVSVGANYGIWIQPILLGTVGVGLYIGDAKNYSLQLASTDGDAASGITFGTDTNLYRSAANTLKTDDSLITVGSATIGTGFGCNAAAAQTAYASGGALSAYAAGANGLNAAADMSALHALVVAMRAALVANGIMS